MPKMIRLLILALAAISISACAASSGARRTAPMPTRESNRTAPPLQIDSSRQYTFAYLRLDELGQPKYGDETTTITTALRKDQSGRGPLVAVFVHGWKHDASSEDSDVRAFRELLASLVDSQATHSDAWRRPVFGIYVDWPANDGAELGPLQNLSFWRVRDRADRVGRAGQVSKLLNHLNADVRDAHGLLFVIGHSFGARLVFESVQQTMASNVINEGRALPSDDCVGNMVCRRVGGFGDLVVLLNPAFEAAQYFSFHQFSGGNWAASVPQDASSYRDVEAWPNPQPPLMLTIGAKNDKSTTKPWAAAHLGADPQMNTTLTNYLPYVTHEIRCSNFARDLDPAPDSDPRTTRAKGILDRTQPFSPAGCANLIPVGAVSNSPFIVARADPEILNGHSGIWSPALREFLVGYMDSLHEAKRIKGWP